MRVKRWIKLAAVTMAAANAGLRAQVQPEPSRIKTDERVVIFPALAHRTPSGEWQADVHGWIYEPEQDSAWRGKLLEALGRAAPLDDPQAARIFEERGHPFIADNESGKRIALWVGGRSFVSEPSGSNGHFRAAVQFSEADVAAALPRADQPLEVRVTLQAGDDRVFRGTLFRVESSGLSVICDIDDTVRVTGVTDRDTLVRSTFFESFRPVPEVRERCRELSQAGAQFHYVSSSPWQLYEPLERFLRDEGFPAGSFHLKTFRLKDSTIFSLFDDPKAHKVPAIEGLLRQWPSRRFILIGDTGEQDPEIYGDIARRFPTQIERVYLRDLRTEGRDSARLIAALRDVPAAKWELITAPPESSPAKP